jgi:phage I-like protein
MPPQEESMLTERLRQVVALLEQLPAEEQDALAASIQAEIEQDRRWKAAMSDPHDLVLDQLIAEAKQQVARGEARDLDESL